ncbi:MAG: hypothetical protein KAS32_17685, partial [Candidatus Peribacteraceae bacterium]|nr:hypothetical protein [Candidatus Peribacteraceae bacterium]
INDTHYYDGEGSFHANVELDSSTANSKHWRIKLYDAVDGTALWVGLVNQDSITNFTKLRFYSDIDGTLTEVAVDTYDNNSEAGWTEWSTSYDSGTWYGTLGPVVAGTTLYTTLTGYLAPDILTPEIYSNEPGQLLDYIKIPYHRKTILDFVGTYNDGSNSGTVNFGDDVISIGDVSEYANTPLNTRGFSASIPVTIDDTSNAWTDFVGDMISPSWLNGTWIVRQEWDGTWYTLLTGNVNAEDVKYNAGQEIVSFSVESGLRRLSENVLSYDAHYSDGTAAGGQVIDSMTLLMELGTITGTGTDNRTISFERYTTSYIHPDGGAFVVKFHDNEYLWEGTEATGDSISIGSTYHKISDENSSGSLFDETGGTYSGTFNVSRVPGWMAIGAMIYYTRRWPNETQIAGAGAYDVYGSNPAGYVKGVLYHMEMGTGAGWTVFEKNLDIWYTVQPQKFYYGGEKFVDILSHISSSALFSYSTDSSGDFFGYVMAPTSGTSSEAIDFNDAYNNSWDVGYTQPVNKVIVKSSWIESENKFGASHEITGADYPSSKTETIEAFWLDSAVYSEGHGVKIQRMYGEPIDQIVLELEGSEWNNITSGAMVAISNIPEIFPIYGTSSGAIKDPDYYVVSGKNYKWADDIVQINLTREIGGDWFKFNISLLNGSDILW